MLPGAAGQGSQSESRCHRDLDLLDAFQGNGRVHEEGTVSMIDENKLKEQMFALVEQIGDERLHIDAVVHLIDDALPTVDAVEVVRCADCIRYHSNDEAWGWCTASGKMRRKDYCSYGVRKDGDDGKAD